ncbi:hypothetical protein [Nocardia vermiculata]|uniref:Uncharacterized protein n=1 Tax=Nocardia vermiculata TaxID=257274 RepID=A0A846XTA4_9NOCA|nr:hypothetical protein [Nocardia vermiculata]NKY48641.1 hypothetical protein [Nocardia vermiculata]
MTDSANARFGEPHNAREGHRLTSPDQDSEHPTDTPDHSPADNGVIGLHWHDSESDSTRATPAVLPSRELPQRRGESRTTTADTSGNTSDSDPGGIFGPAPSVTATDLASYTPDYLTGTSVPAGTTAPPPLGALPMRTPSTGGSTAPPALPSREPKRPNIFDSPYDSDSQRSESGPGLFDDDDSTPTSSFAITPPAVKAPEDTESETDPQEDSADPEATVRRIAEQLGISTGRTERSPDTPSAVERQPKGNSDDTVGATEDSGADDSSAGSAASAGVTDEAPTTAASPKLPLRSPTPAHEGGRSAEFDGFRSTAGTTPEVSPVAEPATSPATPARRLTATPGSEPSDTAASSDTAEHSAPSAHSEAAQAVTAGGSTDALATAETADTAETTTDTSDSSATDTDATPGSAETSGRRSGSASAGQSRPRRTFGAGLPTRAAATLSGSTSTSSDEPDHTEKSDHPQRSEHDTDTLPAQLPARGETHGLPRRAATGSSEGPDFSSHSLRAEAPDRLSTDVLRRSETTEDAAPPAGSPFGTRRSRRSAALGPEQPTDTTESNAVTPIAEHATTDTAATTEAPAGEAVTTDQGASPAAEPRRNRRAAENHTGETTEDIASRAGLSPTSRRAARRRAKATDDDAQVLDITLVAQLLLASHNLENVARTAESGDVDLDDFIAAAHRTRSATVELVSSWFGGTDRMRDFAQALLLAAED